MAALSSIALGTLITAQAVGNAVESRKRGKAEQRVANQNATLAEMQAADAEARGREAASRHRADVRQLIGAQRVAAATQGLDPNAGSAFALQDEAFTMGELDILTIQNNAAREAMGFRMEADNYRRYGRAARQAGDVGAYQSLLGGGIQAYGIFAGRAKKPRPDDPRTGPWTGPRDDTY
jgi:hypothetical protein